jgi:hypothetical protein
MIAMKIGILGLPASGKTTLFQLLSGDREGPDYSHGTKPLLRTVKLADPRLERLREDFQPKKYSPAAFEILDFPPVLKDKDDRSGLADLLAPAREADALLLSLCGFRARGGPEASVEGVLDDWNEVIGELILADLVVVERRLEKLAERSKKPIFSDDDRKEQALLERVRGSLEAERNVTSLGLPPEDLRRLSGFGFLTAKAHVIVLNGDAGQAPAALLESLRAASGSEVLVVSALNELEILDLPEEERDVYLREFGITEPQSGRVIAAAYRAAGSISFFTAGEKEVRAWTIKKGTKAPGAAGAIHSDFERGFIRAEVVSFADYVASGGVKGAKEKGRYRLEGREYVIEDGDIVEFRFSV